MTRRTFLRGAGVTMGLPWLESMAATTARLGWRSPTAGTGRRRAPRSSIRHWVRFGVLDTAGAVLSDGDGKAGEFGGLVHRGRDHRLDQMGSGGTGRFGTGRFRCVLATFRFS